jgi:hypothetical protein
MAHGPCYNGVVRREALGIDLESAVPLPRSSVFFWRRAAAFLVKHVHLLSFSIRVAGAYSSSGTNDRFSRAMSEPFTVRGDVRPLILWA